MVKLEKFLKEEEAKVVVSYINQLTKEAKQQQLEIDIGIISLKQAEEGITGGHLTSEMSKQFKLSQTTGAT